ncbi:hypothetical protein I316_00952 [Kwoniella heveanensis BCC8398]|uniref:Cell cycle checkpoint control protein RAD9A n=1 Tax=Kwoniella heveanensis BCC8398 TaxID=1296120 RepID=A0A1B9H1B7_9TREE|nr:hypothetical protein I316_00952 [Kwoniella heveanensis BCC8398]
MDASIKGDNIRIFTRLLQCAAKYGDDLNIHTTPKVWEMSVTNSSKSAFCLFKLEKSFFCRWDPKTKKGVKCRLLVKSVLAVLGKTSQITTVNRVDLRIVDPSDDLRPPQHQKRGARGRREMTAARSHAGDRDGEDELEDERRFGDEDDWESSDDARVGIEAKLIMRLVCKHGVTKKHSLHLGSSDFLRANVDPDTTPSGFVIETRTLRDWLDHFSIVSSSGYGAANHSSGGSNQLGWMFTQDEVRIKSWEAMGGGGLSTEIKVDVDEFQDYEITEGRVDLTLPMREFKATLVLAEQLSATLNISFSEPGQPLTMTSLDKEFEEFSIFCAIATTICEAFTDVRGPHIDIKRSSSSLARSRNPSQASNNSNERGNARGESPAMKRQTSEVSSQSRKRSTLSMTSTSNPSGDQDRHHAGPNHSLQGQRHPSQLSSIGHANSRQQAIQGRADVDMGDEDQPHQEGLFLPGGSQRDQFPMSQSLPAGMTQQDLDDLTTNLDAEDLADMDGDDMGEEEDAGAGNHQQGDEVAAGDQTVQPPSHAGFLAQAQAQDTVQAGGNANAGPSMVRQRSNEHQPGNMEPSKTAGNNGRGKAIASDDGKHSAQAKSSGKSGPSRVSDSVKGDIASNEHESQSNLVWDLPDDQIATTATAGARAGEQSAHATEARDIAHDVDMGAGQGEKGRRHVDLEEDVDELGEDNFEATQPLGGSYKVSYPHYPMCFSRAIRQALSASGSD